MARCRLTYSSTLYIDFAANHYAGKKGIGLVTLKRPRSPASSQDRVSKMAKMAEESNRHKDFRERAKQQYNEKRAEGRLGPAQRTCITLDEKKGVSVSPIVCVNFGGVL